MSLDKNKGFEYGVQIGNIAKQILDLPLEDLRQEIDKWESFTPFTDPTQYMQYNKLIQQLKNRVEILYTAKQQLKILQKAEGKE